MATHKVDSLIEQLLSHNPLLVAQISDQYIRDDGCQIVCDKLSAVETIHTIDLRGNDLQHKGAKAIADWIQQRPNITTLKLEWNILGEHTALTALCRGLSTSSITHLDLRNNKIDSGGGKILSEMLRGNTTLQHLDLRWNGLGLVGGECILQTLCDNDTLSECLLSGNQIPVQILRSIDAALESNQQHQLRQSQQIRTRPIVPKPPIDTDSDSAEEFEAAVDELIVEPSAEVSLDTTTSETVQEKDSLIHTLQEEINELFGGKTELKELNETLEIKVADLESENLDLTDKLDIVQSAKLKLEKDLAAQQSEHGDHETRLSNKIKSLELGLDENVQSRHGDKREFDHIRESLANSHQIALAKLRELKDKELSTLRETVSALHLEVNELKTVNNTLRSKVLQNEIATERKCIEFEKNLRNECNQTLSTKIDALEQNISAIKRSRDELEVEMSSAKEKYGKMLEQVEAEKTQFQEWLRDEQKAKATLEAEKRALLMNVQKYNNVITQKKQQVEALKIGLSETHKTIKSLENEHQTSMKRVLAQHNRQTLLLEKARRDSEQRLTISEHRKRNLELRITKIEDEEQRKIAAVQDVVKVLTSSFPMSMSLPGGLGAVGAAMSSRSVMSELHEEQKDADPVMSKSHHVKGKSKKVIEDDDDDETIIEIIGTDDEEEDYMRDHNTYNHREKKKKKKKSKKKKSKKSSTKA